MALNTDAMTEQDLKVLENRLRRVAERRGYRLDKCRRRDPLALGFGLYVLVDVQQGVTVLGGSDDFPFTASLVEVAKFLNEPLKLPPLKKPATRSRRRQ